MLFNSLEYIFLFFPVATILYFFLNGRGLYRAASIWLVIASFFFYGYWNPKYILLIVTSITFNFLMGEMLQKKNSRLLVATGITFNLGLLAYFKYANFIVDNINLLFDASIHIPKIELPLAISFFTFLQIAYLVDCYQAKVKETDFLHYALFVTYFPHLIAGPLVHHQELMLEFSIEKNKRVDWANVYKGLYIFAIGIFKKVFIADAFAEWAKLGFDTATPLGFFDAWGASLSYTLQLYFDFSGYSDMAIGASIILNIKLPINFNSPYKALDIQDFWRRWHMTLSRWLREYLYIPLGGNRNGSFFTGVNLCITFLLGGLWHGASWNFVIWGALHGAAVVIHRVWHATGLKLPRIFAWFTTFMYVNLAWVFFRAKTLPDSLRMLQAMTNLDSINISEPFTTVCNYLFPFELTHLAPQGVEPLLPVMSLLFILVFFPLCLLAPNTHEISQRLKQPTFGSCLLIAVLAGIPIFQILFMSSRISEFIYFNF
ncbi:MAG TPA: MBOAT family protein [Pseudomonadales bacterium]|nr:MBOAT family protein [Pseudomonadales bacterium]